MDSINLIEKKTNSKNVTNLVFSKIYLDSFEEKILEIHLKNFLELFKSKKLTVSIGSKIFRQITKSQSL